MKVEKVIADELRNRGDLIKIMDAAAEYLESRDKDPESQARALWKLYRGPSGDPLVGLHVIDEGYQVAQHFTPDQLAPDAHRYRLASLWTDILIERAWRENRRVNELISQYGGD